MSAPPLVAGLLIGALPGLALATAALATAGEPTERPLPPPGAILEREIAGGETHRYPIDGSPYSELWLEVVQDGIDLVIAVVAANGTVRLAVDSPSGLWGEEWLRVRVEPAERIEIRPFARHGGPGRYRLRIEPRSPAGVASPRDLAETGVTAAGELYHSGTREALRRAVGPYRTALAAFEDLGREAGSARVLFNLAVLHRDLGEQREAVSLLRRALAAWQGLGDRRGEAQATMEMAVTAWRLGEGARVEEVCQRASSLWRELGDLQGQARALNFLGLIRARADPRLAREPYEEALALVRQAGDELQEGVVLNNLGGLHDLLGEPHLALAHYRQALVLHRQLGNRRQEAAVLNNIAWVDRQSGRLQDALEGFTSSLEIRRELGDLQGQGRVLNNLGLTWLRLGDPERARAALRESLALRRASEDPRGEAITLHNLGLVEADRGDWPSAHELWRRSVSLRRKLEDRGEEAAALVHLGRAAGRLGRPREGRQYLDEALALLGELGNPWRRAQALWALGEVLTAAGDAEGAVAVLLQALELYRAAGDEIGEGDALLALARAERSAARSDRDRLAAAWSRAVAALDLFERVRADVDSLGLRTSFLALHGGAYEWSVDLAMELDRREPDAGWAARALEVSERARARGLLDLLEEARAGRHPGGRHPSADDALLARQRRLVEVLSAKVEGRRRALERVGPSAASAGSSAEIRDLRIELDAVDAELRRQRPGWQGQARPEPLAAGEIRSLLDPETALLEISLGEARSFLWWVTAQEIAGFELPGRGELEAAARRLQEGWSVHDPRDRSTDQAAAKRLSELLLGSVADRLDGQRLAVVADGALHYLPFAALPHPRATSEPLLLRHEVVVLPSASALAAQRRAPTDRSAERALVVVADPVFEASDPRLAAAEGAGSQTPLTSVAGQDPAYRGARSGAFHLARLAWSRWEAEAIAARVGAGARVVLGFDASLEAVRGGSLRDHRVIHFATHGWVDSEHPELSSLVLSLYDAAGRRRDGFLRLPEIAGLELDAKLVVLSGCRTALGQEIRGEGLVGLTRGFFAAGARRLVASLWQVQDRSTAELMDRFYRRLMEGSGPFSPWPSSPAAALREAQLELLAKPEFADPYHWAAFAVYGDWR